MKRLVIKHGERILRHELGAVSVTVGRDPSCDLPFDDPALSRRHGMFEPTPAGVRFIDLGSRNGSWVNSRKTKEAELKPGDSVRIGGLLITYAYDPPPPPPPPSPPAPPVSPAPDDPADGTATVIVTPRTERLPPKTPALSKAIEAKSQAPPEGDKTLLLQRKESPPDPAGTRIFRAEASKPRAPIDTARLPQEGLVPKPPAPPAEAPPVVPASSEQAHGPDSWSWTAKYALVTTGLALTVYVLLAFPLSRTLGNALREESLRRGRVLLDLLSATNGTAMAEGRARDLQVDMITREERVKETLLLDLQGKVLAPSSRVNETFATIDGIQPAIDQIRTFYLGRRASGDYVMVAPVLDRGQRVGLAVLVYEVATASGSWAVAVLFLAFLVLLTGSLVALVLGKRFTLEPISALRDDVEAVVKGDASRLPLAQGFSELSEVARSINRLIDRTPALSAPPILASVPAELAPERSGSIGSGTAIRAPLAPSVGESARLWVDASFIVVRVDPEAAELVGTSPESMEGRHVIEAFKDQKLLGVVLDSLNALDAGSGAPVVAELPSGVVTVSAARDGHFVVVGLKRTG